MGRTRSSGRITYDIEVPAEEYAKLEARAAEHGTTIEEIVRGDLLSDKNKSRLVPKARKLVRHAAITVTSKSVYAEKNEIPSGERFLDD